MSSVERFSSLLGAGGAQVTIGPFLVRVRSPHRAAAEHLATFYDGFPVRESADAHADLAITHGPGVRRWVRRQASLVVNGARPFLPLPAELAGATIEWGLNYFVGRYAHRWVAVHAAVVECHGTAIVMPAQPGAGKSTLCAALTFAGCRLLSDEFALVDPATGRITPLPRPVSLKDASIEVITRRHAGLTVGPAHRDVNGARFVHVKPPASSVERANDTAQPGLIVFPRYTSGAATTIEPVARAEALLQLADQSFNYNYLGAAGFNGLVSLVRQSACYRLEYSDLDDVLGRLMSLRAQELQPHA